MRTGKYSSILILITLIFYFSAITSKTDFCNLTQIDFTDPRRNETRQKAFYDECVKSDHPNVFICPRSGNPVFQVSSDTADDVKRLETKLKEIKKKKKTNRRKRKRKRKKNKPRSGRRNGKWKRRNKKKRRNKGRFNLKNEYQPLSFNIDLTSPIYHTFSIILHYFYNLPKEKEKIPKKEKGDMICILFLSCLLKYENKN